MKKGKGMLGVIIVSVLLISSVAMVSADFRDWFSFGEDSDLEGELPTAATANIEIAPSSVAPNVTFVTEAFNSEGDQDLNSGPGTTIFTFNFSAKQGTEGSIASLPGSGQEATKIRGNITNGVITRSFVGSACNHIDDGDSTYKYYSCNVAMQFYDIPNSNWVISVQIDDTTAVTQWSEVNDSKTFTLTATAVYNLDTNYVNWTNPALISGSIDVQSNNDVTFQNVGNVDFAQNGVGGTSELVITASDMAGSQGATITAGNFSAAEFDGNYCDVGNNLATSAKDVPYTLGRQTSGSTVTAKNIRFCILKVPAVGAQTFTPGSWEIAISPN